MGCKIILKTQRPPEGPLRALFKVLPYAHPELCLDAVVEHECDHEQVDDDVADRNDDVDSECKSASSDSKEGGDEADDEDHEEEDPHDPVEGADVSIGDLLVDPEDDESEDDADDTADEVSADVVEAESAEGGEDSADDGGVSTTYTNLVTMSNLSETSPDLTLFPNAKYTNAQMRDPIPRMTHPMTWSFISSSTTPQMMVRRAEMIIRIPTIHSAVPAVLVLSRNDIVGLLHYQI